MHWPIALQKMDGNQWSQNEDNTIRYYAEGITLADTWKAMERLVDLKLVRSIGLSNSKPSDIEEILQTARIKPAVNQIELHPFLNQQELREYCAQKQIIITSFCPLANLKRPNELEEASALNNPIIQEIAKSKNRTTAQIIIRWHLQHGLTVIPKTVTPERLGENCQVFDFTLSDLEMHQIDQLDKTNHRRFVNPPFLKSFDKYAFNDQKKKEL
jgi:diketogulonate reductase-like aldo/keto reductase